MRQSAVLRSWRNAVFYGALGVICGLMAAGGAVAALAVDDVGVPAGRLILAAVGLAGLAGILLRASVLRVVLYEECVRIVNPLKTYWVDWGDIEDIDFISSAGWVVRVWMDGEPRWVLGLCSFTRSGLNFATQHDDISRDAPRWLSRAYSEFRRQWRSNRRR